MNNLAKATRDWLSIRALVPSLHLLHMARPSISPGRSVFFEGLRFRRGVAAWSLERKMEWVLQRLRFSLRRAYRETIYYHELFDRIGFDPRADFSFEDFSRLPVLEREDVHRAGRRLISTAVPPDHLRWDATGGSSGTPTEIWMGPEERGWRESGGESFMRRLGLPTGTRIGYFWGHHLDPAETDSLRDRIYCFVKNVKTFNCFRLSPEVFESYHQEFERWRPTCIVAYAGALGNFAEYLLERGYRPSYPKGGLLTAAEKLTPTTGASSKPPSAGRCTSGTGAATLATSHTRWIRPGRTTSTLTGRICYSNPRPKGRSRQFSSPSCTPTACR